MIVEYSFNEYNNKTSEMYSYMDGYHIVMFSEKKPDKGMHSLLFHSYAFQNMNKTKLQN